MTKKEMLLEMLTFAGREFNRTVGLLSEEERAQSGTPERWEARDNLVHIAAWTRRSVQRLRSYRGEGELPPEVEFQEHNERFFEDFRSQPWERFEAYFSTVQQELLQEVEILSEEDLTTPDRFPGLNGQPLWRTIYGNGFEHVIYHLGLILIDRGETENAVQLYEEEIRRTMALDDSDEFRGIALYNLACHYILAGRRDEALSNLELSLPLYPYLYEWAPQDSDFTALREDPDFIRLLDRGQPEAGEPESAG